MAQTTFSGPVTSLNGFFVGATGVTAALTPGFYSGSGAPTLSAPKGSLYLNITGNSTSTRAYINTNGSTTWTAITTAA
jgi:hypothetical protein